MNIELTEEEKEILKAVYPHMDLDEALNRAFIDCVFHATGANQCCDVINFEGLKSTSKGEPE